MGRLFLIQYDQTPHTKLFLCRTCHTHIVLVRNLVWVTKPDNEVHFEEVVNLVIDGPEHYRRVGANTQADANCNKCLEHLGFKYVEDFNEPLISEELRIVLRMDKLLFWNGEQVVVAETDMDGGPPFSVVHLEDSP